MLKAEQAVIGGILLAGTKALDDVSQIVSLDDFEDVRHRVIFEAFGRLAEKEQPFDPVTLCDDLQKHKVLSKAGGANYVSDLAINTPSSANVESYARLAKDSSQKKKLLYRLQHFVGWTHSEKYFDEVLSEIQHDLTKLEPKTEKDNDIESLCKEYVTGWLERGENQMNSGFYDQYTGGIQSGLHIIAAGTGQGKSTFALNIANHLAQNKFGVGIYSYEMPRMKVMERLISQRSRVHLSKLRDRHLNDADYTQIAKAVTILREQRVYIHDQVFPLESLCASIRRGFSKGHIDCAFVDYLQLVPSTAPSREQEVARIARHLQQVAQQCEKPIFALSQLSRAHESRRDPRPRNADLRESGEIEQAAETVLFLYDESKYFEDSLRKDFIELYAGKNRDGELFEMMLEKRLGLNTLVKYLGNPPPRQGGRKYSLE